MRIWNVKQDGQKSGYNCMWEYNITGMIEFLGFILCQSSNAVRHCDQNKDGKREKGKRSVRSDNRQGKILYYANYQIL